MFLVKISETLIKLMVLFLYLLNQFQVTLTHVVYLKHYYECGIDILKGEYLCLPIRKNTGGVSGVFGPGFIGKNGTLVIFL